MGSRTRLRPLSWPCSPSPAALTLFRPTCIGHAGKTDCSKCHSAFGKFCRACLLIRYGYELEEVRQQMAEGTWLCPHCYEEEHPDDVSAAVCQLCA